jgi:hypothetical protein
MIAVAPALLWATDATAGSRYLLTGGTSGSASSTRYTAPGLANTYSANFPAAGLGEQAAQIRMRGARLSKLRVSVVTENATSGSVTVTVRVNGAPTVLTCSVGFAGGGCGSSPQAEAVVTNGDRLAVEVVSTLDQGLWTFTYTVVAN